MKKIFLFILVQFISLNFIFADDHQIRTGIVNAMYEDTPAYIERIYGNNLANVARRNWRYVVNALNEILSWDSIPGYYVISDKVTGYLVNGGVRRKDATPIGFGVREYAKGAR
ncbi:hypothetical protein GKC56_01290 [Neisseriaceae bacterium PsAf]|nr:hypothetical protein [Neisseriaceae bacterium PsAf]MCV2502705.1 hypothetical protein [Neisseriaceae bacterium]